VLLVVLLAIAVLFALLFVARVGGARRAELLARWPAVLLALAALASAARGAIWPAIALGSLAVLAWTWWPTLRQNFAQKPSAAPADDPEDLAARAALGVSPTATASEIRAAYRSKMARAHPDRGGTHAEAARLAAARDRLLKRFGR